MRTRGIGWAATLALAGPALADCTVSADAGAVARTITPSNEADVQVLVSMGMLPKLMHLDYARVTGRKPSCELDRFSVGEQAYILYGDDVSGRERKALPVRKGGPAALMVPVIDIIAAIDASTQGKSARTEGYLLATVTKRDFTGWRYYTGMPDPATLKQDMAAALGGGGSPIFRNGADGKTSIFVTEK